MSGTFLIILFIMAVLAIGIISEIFRTKCPKCGKFFARKILHSNSNYNYDYNTSLNNYQVHKDTTHNCQCKHCGHTWTQRWRSTKRNK